MPKAEVTAAGKEKTLKDNLQAFEEGCNIIKNYKDRIKHRTCNQ